MKGKRSRRLPPWKSKWHWLWLALSLAASAWLILIMPASEGMGGMKRASATMVAAPSAEAKPAEAGKHHGKAGATAPGAAEPSAQPPKKRHHKKAAPADSETAFWDNILDRLDTIGSLLLMVGIAAMIGSIIEARRWHLVFGYILGGFARAMRLPPIVSVAMPTALYSNAAANSMLVASHAEGKINRSALIAGGMANSYLAYVSHSLRVVYPVIGAIGIPGIFYFGGQFTVGLMFILCVLLWNRRRTLRRRSDEETPTAETAPPDEQPQALPWKAAFGMGCRRVGTILFRMLCLTIPLMLFIEWLTKQGLFEFWERHAPDWVHRIFPSELMGIVFAQIGGLVQSATVAAGLRDMGAVTNPQILLAMLVGSMVGNPIRTLRRNLPSALGIFPAREAFTIVLGMQLSRLIGTAILITLTALFIHYTHP
ncbi:hypothetical protein ICN84_06100 [Akkermansia glycaniphila]|uniref:hypothetical protein n=1 Tax=Akkermansia glycaniphila TaxID=1679444 RepID=UPI001C015C1F|nr:hypothetical protein [Akkermansia glycaniphila]MBT9449647.1 hypothetical protein [Akkermansia glycaniphila]